MCFIDFKKAFDSVSRGKIWTIMDMEYPLHLINLIGELYRKQKAKVQVAGTFSERFHVKKGVRQGCVMSPYLFNIMAEMVTREPLDDFKGSIQINGRKITNLRYADDIVLIAQSVNTLQELVTRFDTVSRNKYDLHIDIDKAKVIATNGTPSCITIQNSQLEEVSTFSYLGSVIAEDASNRRNIRNRLRIAQAVSMFFKKLWKSHNLLIHTKIRLLKTLT